MTRRALNAFISQELGRDTWYDLFMNKRKEMNALINQAYHEEISEFEMIDKLKGLA